MNTQQRQLERYRIIYVWKTLEGMVPDSGIEVASEKNNMLGRKCKMPSLKPKERMKRESSFQVTGPTFFNAIPKNIRNITRCGAEDFKLKLDAFLNKIPDEPKAGGLMPLSAMQSNSLLHQVERSLTATRITGLGRA